MQRADIWVPTPRSQAERRALRHLEGLMRRMEKDKLFQEAVYPTWKDRKCSTKSYIT